MKAYLYRNLHKQLYSVRTLAGVVDHVEYALLSNVTLSVGKKGRERVLREKRKHVHAGIRGELLAVDNYAVDHPAVSQPGPMDWTPVYYNPYKVETFVNKVTGEPVLTAQFAFLSPEGAFVR